MSTPKSCCLPCPDVQTINVPGVEGPAGDSGTNGADGLNAFTVTTADFDVPALGNNVTVSVVSSAWMVIGQPVFIAGAGYFSVVSKPTTTSATLTYLNIGVNGNTGSTITAGAGVSPSGNPVTALPATSDYQVGGSQAITASPAQILGSSITLAAAGAYLLIATARFDMDVATFQVERVLTAKLRRTNNTAGDISNAIANFNTGLSTLETKTLAIIPIPAVVYTATAGDTLELFASLDATPYSGSLIAVETSIFAVRLF